MHIRTQPYRVFSSVHIWGGVHSVRSASSMFRVTSVSYETALHDVFPVSFLVFCYFFINFCRNHASIDWIENKIYCTPYMFLILLLLLFRLLSTRTVEIYKVWHKKYGDSKQIDWKYWCKAPFYWIHQIRTPSYRHASIRMNPVVRRLQCFELTTSTPPSQLCFNVFVLSRLFTWQRIQCTAFEFEISIRKMQEKKTRRNLKHLVASRLFVSIHKQMCLNQKISNVWLQSSAHKSLKESTEWVKCVCDSIFFCNLVFTVDFIVWFLQRALLKFWFTLCCKLLFKQKKEKAKDVRWIDDTAKWE